MGTAHRVQDRPPAAVRHVHVEQHHVRLGGRDPGDRLVHRARLAHHVDVRAQLGPYARTEHRVVVDQEDGEPAVLHRYGLGHGVVSFARAVTLSLDAGMVSRTSVPSPGALRISARPPWRCMRPMIEPRTPWRESSTASMSNPAPRSRTNTLSSSASTSAYSETVCTPACRAALTIASR